MKHQQDPHDYHVNSCGGSKSSIIQAGFLKVTVVTELLKICVIVESETTQ
jgi:hypothetical protein